MQCKHCGASLSEDALTCPECGKSTLGAIPTPSRNASATSGATGDAGVGQGTAGAVRTSRAPSSSTKRKRRRTLLVSVAAMIAVAIIATGAWMVVRQGLMSTGPDGAAMRMMNAFAAYDAQGILDNATHASLNATDLAAFSKQAADSKAGNKGLAAVKGISVTKVTIASQEATTAIVQLDAQWLTDASKGTYAQRTETLTVVKQNGKWLVRLFQ
jgi:uncharacterized membrane protein YvbJ